MLQYLNLKKYLLFKTNKIFPENKIDFINYVYCK